MDFMTSRFRTVIKHWDSLPVEIVMAFKGMGQIFGEAHQWPLAFMSKGSLPIRGSTPLPAVRQHQEAAVVSLLFAGPARQLEWVDHWPEPADPFRCPCL